jgi:hypothetical protein
VLRSRPWRILAHITISVLALLLERIAEIRGGDTWRSLAIAAAALDECQDVEDCELWVQARRFDDYRVEHGVRLDRSLEVNAGLLSLPADEAYIR